MSRLWRTRRLDSWRARNCCTSVPSGIMGEPVGRGLVCGLTLERHRSSPLYRATLEGLVDAGRKRHRQQHSGDAAPVVLLGHRKVARAMLTPDATLYRTLRLWVDDNKTATPSDSPPPPVDFYNLPAPELVPASPVDARRTAESRHRQRDAVEREVIHAAEQRNSIDLLRAHLQHFKSRRRARHRQSKESVVQRIRALESRTTVQLLDK